MTDVTKDLAYYQAKAAVLAEVVDGFMARVSQMTGRATRVDWESIEAETGRRADALRPGKILLLEE
jgi:hypothetical protein